VTNDREATRLEAERRIGRLLVALTYVSVALLLVGVGLMLGAGISPMAGGPDLDLATLGSQLIALGPDGFLWLGLLAVISAPISRVVLAGYAYGRAGDWPMVAIAAAILAVIVVGVVTARAGSV
jgi:hypothetical protein